MYTTLINPEDLKENLANPNWRILDCRFVLSDPGKADLDYLEAHIPGAVYLHLERDLSGDVKPGFTGRHPLPAVAQLEKVFGGCGIFEGMQVVVYDALGGALAASRAWWLLRWLGFASVAVLDGGWQKWLQAEMPVRADRETYPAREFTAAPQTEFVLDSSQVEALIKMDQFCLIDSRAADRFRGENETIDPVAGHIPGALSAPYADNLNPDGTFRSPHALRERFTSLLAGKPAEQAVFYCGSGVTACHNILAVEVAGLGRSRLYPGSWSEWITDPQHPVDK